jgi:peptidoglycan/LPS O-acetylase OafA/YrhL
MDKQGQRGAGNDRIDGLDLLRFLLAFAVVLYHLGYHMPLAGYAPGVEAVRGEFAYGRFAVQAFFVISGIVIAASARHRSFGDFVVNRVVRLQPAIIICASITYLAALLLSTGQEPKPELQQWLASVLLLPLFANSDWQADWSYWSLTLELRFYLLAGLFFLFFRSANAMLAGVAVWLAVSLTATLLSEPRLETLTIASAAPCFALGVLIYLFMAETKHRFASVLLGIIAVALMPLQLMEPVPYTWQAIGWVEAVYVTLAIVALIIGFTGARNLGRFTRVARVLGAVSYPLYLVHQFVGYYLVGSLMQAGVVWEWAVTVAVASVTALAFAVALFAEPVVARHLRAFLQWARHPQQAPA